MSILPDISDDELNHAMLFFGSLENITPTCISWDAGNRIIFERLVKAGYVTATKDTSYRRTDETRYHLTEAGIALRLLLKL